MQPTHSLVFSRDQKLQEFLSNAAKSGTQAESGQGERSDVTVAALLGGVKRRGDVADEGDLAWRCCWAVLRRELMLHGI